MASNPTVQRVTLLGEPNSALHRAKAISLEQAKKANEHMRSLRQITQLRTSAGESLTCEVVAVSADGDCGLTAISRSLILMGYDALASQITRNNITEKVREYYLNPDFKVQLDSMFTQDRCGDLNSWVVSFSKPGGIWIAEQHLRFLSLAYKIRFNIYYANVTKEQFEPELSNEVIYMVSGSIEPIDVHLAHVNTEPGVNLNHYEGLCINPTHQQHQKITEWLSSGARSNITICKHG